MSRYCPPPSPVKTIWMVDAAVRDEAGTAAEAVASAIAAQSVTTPSRLPLSVMQRSDDGTQRTVSSRLRERRLGRSIAPVGLDGSRRRGRLANDEPRRELDVKRFEA